MSIFQLVFAKVLKPFDVFDEDRPVPRTTNQTALRASLSSSVHSPAAGHFLTTTLFFCIPTEHHLDRKATLSILVIGSLYGINRAIRKAYAKYHDEFKANRSEIKDKFKKTFLLK